MNNIQAALGVAQLERLEAMLVRKKAIHAHYAERFAKLRNAKLLTPPSNCDSACWMAVLETSSQEARNACIKLFEERRIQARPFWALNNTHPMYAGSPKSELAVAESLQARCVCIPCASQMGEAEAERVVSAALAFGALGS